MCKSIIQRLALLFLFFFLLLSPTLHLFRLKFNKTWTCVQGRRACCWIYSLSSLYLFHDHTGFFFSFSSCSSFQLSHSLTRMFNANETVYISISSALDSLWCTLLNEKHCFPGKLHHLMVRQRKERWERDKKSQQINRITHLYPGDLINLRHRVCSPLSLYLFCSSSLSLAHLAGREQLFNVTALYIFFYAPRRVSPMLSVWENSRDNKIKCERNACNKWQESLPSIHLFRADDTQFVDVLLFSPVSVNLHSHRQPLLATRFCLLPPNGWSIIRPNEWMCIASKCYLSKRRCIKSFLKTH